MTNDREIYTLLTILGITVIVRNLDGSGIPKDPANTDYQKFKVDLAEGATLLDAEGNEMTPEQVGAFLKELP